MNTTSFQDKHIQFVTGKLAEHALRDLLTDLSSTVGFSYSVDVLPITVAALMTPEWVSRKITPDAKADFVIIPGYCSGDTAPIAEVAGAPVKVGPHDLRRLPEFFGLERSTPDDFGSYDIEIIAEINHAPRLSAAEIMSIAESYRHSGADVIDIGCDPGSTWSGIGTCIKSLVSNGFRVSVDSLNVDEITPAVEAGAELVLSVNESNRHAAKDWGCEVVVIPDDFPTLGGLQQSIEILANDGVPLRVDPILEPIGCGFTASLQRYISVREQYPDVAMMMGIGNLTELTDVDSSGINMMLLGICQELSIQSVLTTEVINWARSSVAECNVARRLSHYAVQHGIPPKHLDDQLVVLRDCKLDSFGRERLDLLATQIKDNNYRIYAENGEVHIVSAGLHLSHSDPFKLFELLMTGEGQDSAPGNLDASHAFYLGYEMCKAITAVTLGKQYTQDESLDWGHLTVEEVSHRLKRKPKGDG